MSRLIRREPATPWKEAPYVDKKLAGLSVWTWVTVVYYVLWLGFAGLIARQPYPAATKAEMMIISFGVGLNWAVGAWLIEREGRVRR
jgi:hypothetical protein